MKVTFGQQTTKVKQLADLLANIRNVMIDEFQDTSRMQWDNFRLLLLEGLSQGADSRCV